MSNTKHLSGAIRLALFAGATSLFAAPAFAQEDQQDGEETQTLDRVEVTGSRIGRAQIEGALPVTVIDRQQLELSGDTSVADYLRGTTFNSFGSFRPQSGSSAQSVAQLSLRGLGGERTLILIDGRRAPVSPTFGSGQDLNSIPLAAVERIEILTDGASAVYGSDAIGGVVNIITRRDFSGAELRFGFSNPTLPGGETEEASAVVGVSGERGSVMIGTSYNNRGIIFQRERPWSTGGVSSFSNELYSAVAAPGTLYGFVAGSRFINPTFGSNLPGFGCNTNGFFTTGTGAATRCLYDFTFVAADEAEVRNSALFARSNFEINEDWSMYLNASTSRVESFGRYAPVPSSPWPGGSIFIPVGSPNHPAVRFPGAGYNASTPYFLRHRFAAAGNRDQRTDGNVYSLDLGADGRIGDVGVNFGVRRAESKQFDIGRGYILASAAQAAISSGAYNIYDPFSNSSALLNSFTVTTARTAQFVSDELYASANMDLFELSGGTAAIAFGGEYRKETYQDLYDSLSEAGVVSGSSGNSAGGGRSVRAVYAEVLLPVLADFEINIAARHDRYSDYGSDTSPKIAFRYNPIDSLTLRASYGKGFRAPSLDIVTALPSFGAAGVSDPQTCVAFGQAPTCSTQVTSYTISNPNLSSEQSSQWSAGAVWDATDWLNMSLDYWSIEIEDQIDNIGAGQILACLAGTSTVCPTGLSNLPANVTPPNVALGLGVARAPVTGEILYMQLGFVNLGTIEQDGWDFNARTEFDFNDWGTLRNQLQVSATRNFQVNGGANAIGEPGVPEYRAALINTYDVGDFTFGWNVNYIHNTDSFTFVDGTPSYTTHDVQATWNAPWNGKVTFGVTNLGNKGPPLDPADPGGRGYDFNLYDGYGRIPYFRYTQSF